MRGVGEVFEIFLQVENFKVFVYNLLSGFGCAHFDLIVRRYWLLLGVKWLGYERSWQLCVLSFGWRRSC